MRDYRSLLAAEQCWDHKAERLFEEQGEGALDLLMHNREELIGLCEFIELHGIRSYLEIGVWTGATVRALHRIFSFDKVAACDHGWAEQFGLRIRLPEDCSFLRADSDSEKFCAWRKALGSIDLVMIDANHNYHAVARDVAINRGFPYRFLALHDITGYRRSTKGVAKVWNELPHGTRHEIVRPHLELGLTHSTMGIGIWSEHEGVDERTGS